MFVVSLQSGSNGNSIYIETGSARLLIDAGISGIQAQERLAAFGRDIRSIDAVIITHDHSDHVRCMGVYQRKFGLPAYITSRTLSAAAAWQKLGKLSDVRHFRAGERIRFGTTAVETVPTPHDGVDGVAVVVDDGRRRMGVLTDLGHAFEGLDAVIDSLDGVLLESNYDCQMLVSGPYPEFLKQRIQGPGGHLSNDEAAAVLCRCATRRLQWACLGHLSEQNNEPRVAMETHRRVLGADFPLHIASRYQAAGPWQLV